MRNLLVSPRTVIDNPDAKELKRLTGLMPTARETVFGNHNVSTRVTSRSKGSTYVVDDDPSRHSDQTITRAEYQRWAKLQDDHIRLKPLNFRTQPCTLFLILGQLSHKLINIHLVAPKIVSPIFLKCLEQ